MVRQWIPNTAKAAFAASLVCFTSALFAEEGEERETPPDNIRYRVVAGEDAAGVPATVRAAIQELGEGKVLLVTEAEEGEVRRAEVQSELIKKVNESKYWIGVVCDAIDDSLKTHLGIDSGLVVQEVIDGGPAAKAGVKQFDVLVDLEGKKLSSIETLVDAVEARGEKESKIYFYRKGKEGTITITPAARPKPGEKEDDRHFKLELRPSADDAKTFEMMIVRPGMAVPQVHKIPDDVTIKFLKRGGKPGEFEIKRGEKTWTASEDKLEDLPEDIRRMALQIRGAHLMPNLPNTFTLPVEPGKEGREGARMTIRALPPGVTPRVVAARAIPATPATPVPVAPPIPHAAPPLYAAMQDGQSRQLAELNKKLDAVLAAVKGKSEVEKLQDEVERLRRDVDALQRQLDRRER